MENLYHHQAGQIAVEGMVCRFPLASRLGSQCLYGTRAPGSSRGREEINGSNRLGFSLGWFGVFFLFNNAVSLPVLAQARPFWSVQPGKLVWVPPPVLPAGQNQVWEQRLLVRALAKRSLYWERCHENWNDSNCQGL